MWKRKIITLPDEEIVLDPVVQGVTKSQVGEWRDYLRYRLYIKRKGLCDACRRSLAGFDVHEALITRAQIHKSADQWVIFSEYNCLILHPQCHIPQPPSREQAFEILSKYYGEDIIREWLKNLPTVIKYHF